MSAAPPARVLVVEADGGSRGNPGPAGYGAVVRDPDTGAVLQEAAGSLGVATNNVAEYHGLIAGLEAAVRLDPGCRIEVRMDSKLVVEQMSGRWQIKHADMRTLAARARGVVPPERVRYTWIPRASNAAADRLANEAMDAAAAGRSWRPRDLPAPTGGAEPPGRDAGTSGPGAAPSSAVAPAGSPPTAPGLHRHAPDSMRAPGGATPRPATTLVLVRHGRTAYTEAGRFSGSGPADPPLSAAGRADAQAVAAALAATPRWEALAGCPPVSAVLASPLQRTSQTATTVAGALGLPVVPAPEWVESGFGEWDGLTAEEIARRWPEEFERWKGSATQAPPGGESLDEVAGRIAAARRELVAGHLGRCVVVVTHTTPVRCVVRDALEAPPAALWRLRIAPCSVTVVRFWEDGEAEVRVVNAQARQTG